MTVAPSSAIAPPVSVLRKSRTGAARLRAHAVLPAYPEAPPGCAATGGLSKTVHEHRPDPDLVARGADAPHAVAKQVAAHASPLVRGRDGEAGDQDDGDREVRRQPR